MVLSDGRNLNCNPPEHLFCCVFWWVIVLRIDGVGRVIDNPVLSVRIYNLLKHIIDKII